MNDDMIRKVLADPSASHWLKNALRSAAERDPVDAAADAEYLCRVLVGDRSTEDGMLGLPWRLRAPDPLHETDTGEIEDETGAVVLSGYGRSKLAHVVRLMNRHRVVRELVAAVKALVGEPHLGEVDNDDEDQVRIDEVRRLLRLAETGMELSEPTPEFVAGMRMMGFLIQAGWEDYRKRDDDEIRATCDEVIDEYISDRGGAR